ncbi:MULTISPECIES: amino acid ABC transporter permease [unclassified Rhizobium]|uniref:amino acid ABC transporter permease n=1 Tax=unclassified Rhizobium TaxID=2613769 RepID=UPI001ADBF194|nr:MULTISPECIES: amino acid ABC transporter permease [unclassified Rhizobium]MBO9127717.1 amino acid ABC transporter permease [Rhizobium sp. 16-488-2b]MBO9178179.1 amino acid ABC transporter permease [Rhizobium sp. 16-488-2a]
MENIISVAHDALTLILTGLPIVLLLTVLAFFPALGIGIVGGLAASSRYKVLRIVASSYVYVFRSTPFLMFIFLVYYGLPAYDVDIGPVTTAVIALSLSHGAYMTEIIRGGLKGVDKGQNEAAIALGFNFLQRIKDITLPQTLMMIIPSLLGQAILIIKDTSLVSVVGISEITRLGREVVIRTNEPFIVFTLLGITYFVVCSMLELVARKLENRARRVLSGH